ncbi:MAG: hypothetical protein J6M06_04230, partial [Synergistaceae bacterium]|nr:hypothetical protein [Synergistaceae bacterium]
MPEKEYFVLRSKDVPLCVFSRKKYLNFRGRVRDHIDIAEVYNTELLPFELRAYLTADSLSKWISSRVTPMGRNLLRIAGGDPGDLLFRIEKTLLLSLNDTYWVDRENGRHTWAEVNLYDNDFSPTIGSAVFSSAPAKEIHMLERSPEFVSSKGNLRKCWVIRNGARFLLKADNVLDTHDGRSQVTSERFASLVADAMQLPHVPYKLEMFTHADGLRELVCSCPLFTSADIGYVEAYRLLSVNPRTLSGQDALADFMGRESYEDMMVFDAVI